MELSNQIQYLLTSVTPTSTLADLKLCIEKLNLNPTYPIILVGGTNGKGSVCAYLSTILTIAGYKVGSFTSPHVLRYNERISLNNQAIDDDTLNLALTQVINTYSSITNTANNLCLFQAFTLAAHLIFIQQKIDIAIIEVGIGGEHDITNLFEPTFSAITNVALDHCELLGNTVEQIAKEKAGIFRTNKYGFYGELNPPQNITSNASLIGTKLQLFGIDFGLTRQEFSFDVWCQDKKYYSLPYPALRGNTQPNNVALALTILHKLHHQFPISLGVIKTGLLQTSLIGRFQVLPGIPQIILDVAHNTHSITNMLQNMLKLPFAKESVAVFGIAKDKEAEQIIQLCKDSFNKWFIAKTNQPRGQTAKQIAQILKNNNVLTQNIVECDSIEVAYLKASKCKPDRITCFGSFLVVEEAYNTIQSTRK